MAVTLDFLFIGGTTALDFVNTELVADGSRVDLLQSDADLNRWLSKAGLTGHSRRRASFTATALADAKRLRGGLRTLFERVADAGTIRPADVEAIHEVLAGTKGRLRLDLREGRVRFDPNGAPRPAFLIAESAAAFLASAEPGLIRRCGGAGCILLFYDTTKSHTRRWCSMGVCGNRSKAAAHYERSRRPTPLRRRH
jgi:predicted RNA-binding Zn ribbon-like protein